MPTETIVAVFPSLSTAEAAISDLVASGVSSASIKHYARDEASSGGYDTDRSYDTTRSDTGAGHQGGFWAWLTGQDTTREQHDIYDRSIESGRTVVTVISDGSNIDQIYSVLERHEPLDLDEHDGTYEGVGTGSTAAGYSGTGASSAGLSSAGTSGIAEPGVADPQSGFQGTGAAGTGRTGTFAGESTATGAATGTGTTTGTAANTGVTGADIPAAGTPATSSGMTGAADLGRTGETREQRDVAADRAGVGTAGTGFAARTPTAADTTRTGNTEEVIPLAEETLDVGKRQVSRGSTRIRRYVVERPIEEQIRLRDEAVQVFRRPASGSASVGEDAFREREIVVNETGEEAVVAKTARVVEEVVVQKGVEEHVETVRDTVRREEVEIDGPAGRNVEGTAGTSPTGTRTGIGTSTETGPGTGSVGGAGTTGSRT